MTKAEFVKKVAERAGVGKKKTEAVINAFMEVVAETLKEGEKVYLRGFGTFLMKKRSARTARNPKTGKVIKVPPKLVPAFKPGKSLKEATEKVLK